MTVEGPKAGGLQVGILGPVQVAVDGAELASPAPGPRAVLAALALAAGGPVRLATAVELLWGGDPPRSAAGVLHTYVSRIRSLLTAPPGSDRVPVLTRDASGYRLRLTADELDMLQFRRLVAQARVADDPGQAGDRYEQALGLWRGEPLADVDVLQRHPGVTALAAERACAVLEYAELASAYGWHDREIGRAHV